MGPLGCTEYNFYTKHESTEQFLLQIKIIVYELLFLMTEILQLPYTPIFMVSKMIVKTQKLFFQFPMAIM